jgi:uncharacterized membrane protein YfcA
MLIPGLVLGVGGGWLILDWFLALPNAELWMKRVIGFLAVSFVGVQFYRMQRENRLGVPGKPYEPRPSHGVLLGASAGLTSTLAHAGGPLIVLFLLPQKLDRRVFVGTVIKYFFVGNLVKLYPYTREGLLNLGSLKIAAVLVPCVVAGTFIGVVLNRKFSDRVFRFVVYALALCVGLYLLSGWQPGGGEEAESPGAQFEQGMRFYAEGRYDSAATAFRRSQQEDRLRYTAALNRGLALYMAGRLEEAATALRIPQQGRDGLLRLRAGFNLGNCSYRRGDYAAAAEQYERVVAGVKRTLRTRPHAAATLAELLERASHNLGAARARLGGDGSAQQPAERPETTSQPASRRDPEMAAAARPAAGTEPDQPASEEATGAVPTSEAGRRTVAQILSAVAARDTGPVLRGNAAGTAPGGRDW